MRTAFKQVAEKVKLGLEWWENSEEGKEGGKLGSLVVSGGVASNQFLRIKSVFTFSTHSVASSHLLTIS